MRLDERLELSSVALACAREASKIVAAGWRKRPAIEHKGPVDLVTSFDRDSEDYVREFLTRETRITVVAEEQGGDRARGDHGATWFVDPLDGTTNFVHGHPFFCVSIGLIVGRAPAVGAVVAPALGVEWRAAVDPSGSAHLATRNNEPCRVSEADRFCDSLLATGFPYDRQTSDDNNFDAFVAIKKRCQAVRRCGSAAIDLCFVADGTYDGYWEKKLKPWDLAAGAALVVAAGGRISNYSGELADVLAGNLLATNGRIHDALVRELADV